MPRYAVLRDIHDPDLRPLGLVTEHDDRVRVLLAEQRGIRSDWHRAYQVSEPDGSTVIYEPGRENYFDHVLLSLSRTFVVSEINAMDRLDDEEILGLYYEKVAGPRDLRSGGGRYIETPTRRRESIYASANPVDADESGLNGRRRRTPVSAAA